MEIASQEGNAISSLSDDTTNVKDFLREYGVTDGSTLVPNYYLYYAYCKLWNPHGKKLSKIGFLRKVNVVFTSKRNKHTRYFLLNLEVTKEDLDVAKRFDKRYRKRVKEKNSPTTQSETPSTTEEV